MDFDFLFSPLEALDGLLEGLFEGAPLVAALALALALGLRHASDPDHLVAVTSLVAARRGDVRAAARLGGFWGVGHAATLLAVGLPLVVLKSELPLWLEHGAERVVGVVIALLAARLLWRWARGGYRARTHPHTGIESHRHLHRHDAHSHARERAPLEALGLGVLHGLAGSGAVALLLVAALDRTLEAALALTIFATAAGMSMTGLTAAFAWALTRPPVEPVWRVVLVPVLGLFGVLFGAWYAV